ncbi:MAG: hypothetical protein WCA08_20425 [Desulfoferrobacter sp.]
MTSGEVGTKETEMKFHKRSQKSGWKHDLQRILGLTWPSKGQLLAKGLHNDYKAQPIQEL